MVDRQTHKREFGIKSPLLFLCVHPLEARNAVATIMEEKSTNTPRGSSGHLSLFIVLFTVRSLSRNAGVQVEAKGDSGTNGVPTPAYKRLLEGKAFCTLSDAR